MCASLFKTQLLRFLLFAKSLELVVSPKVLSAFKRYFPKASNMIRSVRNAIVCQENNYIRLCKGTSSDLLASFLPTDLLSLTRLDANTFCKVQGAMIIRGKSESIYISSFPIGCDACD